LRHRLNEIVSLETLEQVTAEAQSLSDEFQTSTFRLQLVRRLAKNKIRNEKPEISDRELNELVEVSIAKKASEAGVES
jgi:hypothetical protein